MCCRNHGSASLILPPKMPTFTYSKVPDWARGTRFPACVLRLLLLDTVPTPIVLGEIPNSCFILGFLLCSCNTCDGSKTCIVDKRSGGKCLVDVDQRVDGKTWINLGCVKQSQFQCHNSRCCADRDLCNLHLLQLISPTPDPDGVIEQTPTTVDIFSLMTVDAKPTAEATFECHCSSCPRHSCRTSDYCVVAASGQHKEYGCVHINDSVLMLLCESRMPHIYCCKGTNCNKNKHPTDSPTQSGRTGPRDIVRRRTSPPQPENCKLTSGSGNELKDSEYIVILVGVTVPSFFIFLALTVIFCYTVRKYHKQTKAQTVARGTSVSARNCVSRLSNGKIYTGALKD